MLSKMETKKINEYRSLFPRSVQVKTERSKSAGFFAEITAFPGCFTEAESFSELIGMVNDAVRTYFEIPAKYLPYMPTYIPPLKEAKRLDVFPISKETREMNLEFSRSSEKVTC